MKYGSVPQYGRTSQAPYDRYPVFRLLERTAHRLPGKVAIIDGDRQFTFRGLNEYSDRFAGALASMGIKKGDVVGVMAPNCAEFSIAFYGILKSGGVATTINPSYREREIAHQIADSGAGVLVVHPAVLPTVQAVMGEIPGLQRLVIIEETSGNPASFWGLIESAYATPPAEVFNPNENLAVLPYSSGTTGLPKGVMLSHFNLTANYRQFVSRPGEGAAPREDDIFLTHLPLFHIYGLQVLMNVAIGIGATQVFMGRFDMDLLLHLVSHHRVTQLYTVPPVGLGLTNYPGVENYDLSALRVGVLAAAPTSAELQKKVQETLGCPVIQGYGMTELSPVVNIDFMESDRVRPGSIGLPTADTEERVVDLDSGTAGVAPGEMGELMVRGPQVMKGYLNKPAATAETVTPDGWLHTGDIVTMDREGYVWVHDRKKELIKYKGFQVAPAELEGILQEHPGVVDAAVIGREDLESGEVPKAFIVSRPGAELSAEGLMAFVAGKVATFKQVREVEFVDSIPKNPSGKILRRVLIEQDRALQRERQG